MTATAHTPIAEPLSFHAIPRMGWLPMLLRLLRPGSERIDMRTPLERLCARHGDVVVLGAGPVRFVSLLGPDANRFVLTDRNGIFSARIPWAQILGRLFPNGLLLRDGAEHRHHRKIMHEACKRSVLHDYFVRMNPRIEAGLGGWDRARPLLAFRAFKELTLDMAASIFAGIDLGPGTRRIRVAFEDMEAASMSRLRLPVPGLEFHRGLKGRESLAGFLRGMLETRRAHPGPDMFSRLCRAETKEGRVLRDQEVIDHMIFLIMAAHDTTASALTSLVYELARRPEWQERVRDESRELGKTHADLGDLDCLTALTWTMREALRRYPPLPVIPRVALEAFVWGGYRIPARTMVVVSPIHTHHMRDWWTTPDVFDPERFAPDRAEDQRHTHSWIPFGSGAHVCLGRRFAEAQIRAVVHQLVLRYRWGVPEGYTMPVQQAPISKPRDGLPLQVERLA